MSNPSCFNLIFKISHERESNIFSSVSAEKIGGKKNSHFYHTQQKENLEKGGFYRSNFCKRISYPKEEAEMLINLLKKKQYEMFQQIKNTTK